MILLACLVSLTLLGGRPTLAQPPEAPEAPATQPAAETAVLPKMLEQLASPDFATREAATHTLLARESLSDDVIRDLYAHATLPEQRQRLQRVARHHLLRRLALESAGKSGPGSIGIAHQAVGSAELGEAAPVAVCVLRTFPGFPGYVHLQEGDLITAVGNSPLSADVDPAQAAQRFIDLVKRHKVGQTIHLSVRRDGQELRLKFALGPAQALRQMYDASTTALLPPFRQRWEKLQRELKALEPPAPALAVPAAKAN